MGSEMCIRDRQSLSNQELETLNRRMQLEQNHKNLRKNTGPLTRAGKSAVVTMVAGAAGAALASYAKDQGKEYAEEYLLPYLKKAASSARA